MARLIVRSTGVSTRLSESAGRDELEQRVDQIGETINRDADLQIKLFALRGGELGIGKEFGVGQYRGEGMPQIMRDGAGHAPNRGEALRIQEPLLGLPQTLTHTSECLRQLGNFAGRLGLHGITIVAAAQSAHAIHQLL